MAVKRKSTARKARVRRTATRPIVARKPPARRRAPARRKTARRKTNRYQSALSMITSYLDRGGRTLPQAARKALNQAKKELRKLVGRR